MARPETNLELCDEDSSPAAAAVDPPSRLWLPWFSLSLLLEAEVGRLLATWEGNKRCCGISEFFIVSPRQI